jgi:hypothetical protein
MYGNFFPQAMVMWNKEVCKYREATEPNPDSNMEMFTRRGLAEGAVPPDYVAKYATPETHLQLVRTLDFHFDNFKRINKLDLKNMNPVAVVLNLLPEGWEAKVCKAVDDEHGLIVINHSQGGSF